MHFELLKKVVAELSAPLSNARVAKIYQPAANLLIFRLWTGKENLRLLLSTEPRSSRIHLSAAEYPNPFTPPRFCQLLRARISRILSIEILNDDRVVALHCNGPKGATRLILELTGAGGNMFLVDAENLIIDVLSRKAGQQGERSFRSGELYRLPEKLSKQSDAVHDHFEQAPGSSVNASVEEFYRAQRTISGNTDLLTTLQKVIHQQQKKLMRRLEKISAEQGRQQKAEQFKQFGELLLANLHAVLPGTDKVEVLNYYLQPAKSVVIALDSRLNPQQNAERYFKHYKKAKRGLEHSRRRAKETQEEITWLESLDFQLQEATTAAIIEEVAAECRQGGLLGSGRDRYAKKQPGVRSQPLESQSPSGLKVLWGRNNRQNDYLSTKILKAGDLWFHAHQYPGAHVILKAAGAKQIKDEDKRFAAALAAGYSKAKNAAQVEVMQAEAGDVRKPKATRPGLVTVKSHRIIVVQPLRIEE